MTSYKVEYDYLYQQWVLEYNNGDFVYCDTKQQLEDYLDHQENLQCKTSGCNDEGPKNEAE